MTNHCKGTRGRKKSVVSKRGRKKSVVSVKGRKKAVGRRTPKLKGGWWWKSQRQKLINNITKAQKAIQMCTPEEKNQLDNNLTNAKKALENFNDAQQKEKNLKKEREINKKEQALRKKMNKKEQVLREQKEENALRKATNDDEKSELMEEFEKQKRIYNDDLKNPGRNSDDSYRINLNNLNDPELF